MPPNHHSAASVQVKGQDDGCCGIFFLKYILYIFNFILLLSGLAVLGVGLLALYMTHNYVTLLGSQLNAYVISVYLLVGTGGAIIFIVFIIGCVATCNKNRSCLMTYSVFLMVIFLAEIGAGILAYMYEVTLTGELGHKLHGSMKHQYRDNEAVHRSLDSLQSNMRCCGVNKFDDWFSVSWSKTLPNTTTAAAVPDSCCKTLTPECGLNTGPSNINMIGCLPLLEDKLQLNLIVIGGVGLGLCCLQIFGIIFACCLAKKVRRWKVRENTYWE